MSLYQQLLQRAAEQKPIRIGLIGAGKFGSMYLELFLLKHSSVGKVVGNK